MTMTTNNDPGGATSGPQESGLSPRQLSARHGRNVLRRGERGSYVVSGYPDLRVDPQYEGPTVTGWTVIDTRYWLETNRYNRWQVITRSTLDEIREWILGGGPARWDPRRRITDRNYEP
jgi:hypothetical protein